MHKLGRHLGDPIKDPGTRFANEFHGTNFGRLIHEIALEGEKLLVRPRKCPKCHVPYQIDEHEFLCCPVCGQEPVNTEENASRKQAQSAKLEDYKRLKAYKKYRTYGVKAI